MCCTFRVFFFPALNTLFLAFTCSNANKRQLNRYCMLIFRRCLRSCIGVAPGDVSPLSLLRFVCRDGSLDSPLPSPTVASTLDENPLSIRTLVLDELSPRQLDLFFQCVDFVTHGLKMLPPAPCQRVLARLVRKTFKGSTDDGAINETTKHHTVRPLLDVVLFQNVEPFCGWFHHGYEETLLPKICKDCFLDTLLHSSSGMWLQRRATMDRVKSAVYHSSFRVSLIKPFHEIGLATLEELNAFYLHGLSSVCIRHDYAETEHLQLVQAIVEARRIPDMSRTTCLKLCSTPSGAVLLMRYLLNSGEADLSLKHELCNASTCLQGMWHELRKLLDVEKEASVANPVEWGLEMTLPTACALLDHTFLLLFGGISHPERTEVWSLLITELEKMHNVIVGEDAAFLEHFDMGTAEPAVAAVGEVGLYDNAFFDQVLHETSKSLPHLRSVHSQGPKLSCNGTLPSLNTYEDLCSTLVGMGLNSNGYLTKMLAACDMLSSAFAPLCAGREPTLSSLEEVDSFHSTLQRMRHSLRVVIGRRYMLAPHPSRWSEFDRQRALPFLDALSVSLCVRKRFAVLMIGPPGMMKQTDPRRLLAVCTKPFLTLSFLFPGLTPSILYAEGPPRDPPSQTDASSWSYFPCRQQGVNHSHDCYLRVTSEQVKKIKQLTRNNAHEGVALGLICTENAAVKDVFPLEEWYQKVFPLVLRS